MTNQRIVAPFICGLLIAIPLGGLDHLLFHTSGMPLFITYCLTYLTIYTFVLWWLGHDTHNVPKSEAETERHDA